MMTIPALFASSSGNTVYARDTFFHGTKVDEGPESDYKKTSSKLRDTVRKPIVVVDSNSINMGSFDESVMKKMAVKGCDIWFMTYIENVDDVFDAFNTVAENILAPLHTISDNHEFKDILSVSDSVIPAIFVNKGKGYDFGGKTENPLDLLEKTINSGYCRACIVDTDNSISGDTWERISDDHPASLPFVSKTNNDVYFGDFRNIIIPQDS